MRAFDRDLIRGGHYGQRSCEPHPKAEHMAAPTNAAHVMKALANPEPSTHGPERTCWRRRSMSAWRGEADTCGSQSHSPGRVNFAKRCSRFLFRINTAVGSRSHSPEQYCCYKFRDRWIPVALPQPTSLSITLSTAPGP